MYSFLMRQLIFSKIITFKQISLSSCQPQLLSVNTFQVVLFSHFIHGCLFRDYCTLPCCKKSNSWNLVDVGNKRLKDISGSVSNGMPFSTKTIALGMNLTLSWLCCMYFQTWNIKRGIYTLLLIASKKVFGCPCR